MKEITVGRRRELQAGKFQLSAISLDAVADFTDEDLVSCGRLLARMEGSVQWWIGDLARLVPKEGGEHKRLVKELAEACGFDPRTVQQYEMICRNVDLNLRFQELTFAHHRAVASLEPNDQEEWLATASKNDWSVAELRREIRLWQNRDEARPGRAQVRQSDAVSFLKDLRPQSVDLLLTDPPYLPTLAASTDNPKDIRIFVRGWLPLALSRVKPTGRAYIFTGPYPEELAAYLEALKPQVLGSRLTLGNVLIWTYRNNAGPKPKMGYKLNWQACFYLYGPDAPPLDCSELVEQFSVQDVTAPDGRHANRFDTWQKPDELGERFVRHSTRPNDLVVDPFCGTGTFLLAAKKLGRKAEGCDIDPKKLEICRRRGIE